MLNSSHARRRFFVSLSLLVILAAPLGVQAAAKKTSKKAPTVKLQTDVSKFKNANYKGPFPAPEGIVLEGTFGEDTFQEPSGKGEYRFKVAKTFKQHLACLDKTRTIFGSKGKTWEEGWFKGHAIGKKIGESIVPIYDEKPQGSKAGNKLFDEGYRLGYNYGFNGGTWYMQQYNCKGTPDLRDVDADGWMTYKSLNGTDLGKKMANLVSVSVPVAPWAYLSTTGTTTLSGIPNVVRISMDTVIKGSKPEDAPHNKGKPVVNLSDIEMFENTEADDNAMTPGAFAQALYDMTKTDFETKNKGNQCTLSAANIEDKKFGNHTFTLLTYYTTCISRKTISPLTDTGNEGGIEKDGIRYNFRGKLQAWAFTKGAQSGHLFAFYFINPFDLHTKGAKTSDDLDASKFPSNSFIEQFLTKIAVK
ncbi:MAG: hypothetical protein AAB551_03975 [Patescibacteria group bacterium]